MNVCADANMLTLVGILKKVLSIMQIAIPILLLLFGTIDLGKAVIAGDEKEIKGATDILIKRVIAAVAVFILVLVVSIVTGWVGGTEWKNCWNAANTSGTINPISTVS